MDQTVENKAMRGMALLKVSNIHHWTDRTFSFDCERPASFRFRSGEFVMIGLIVDGKPLLRAYSIASPSWDEELEFYSIKVAEGPLTSRLQHLKEGDEIVIRPKPVGTLVHDALLPGKRLFLFSTGTGIAPFASVIRDPETYEKFEHVILTHTCRDVHELDYGKHLMEGIRTHEFLPEIIGDKLTLISTTTREESERMGRMTDWIRDGRLASAVGGGLDPATDRVMICGSMAMLQDHKAICEELGFVEGANSEPGQFVIEKAFVD
jgi:ferredoxin--NADP+ reductase